MMDLTYADLLEVLAPTEDGRDDRPLSHLERVELEKMARKLWAETVEAQVAKPPE